MTTAKQAAPVIAESARLVGSVMATAVKAFMSLPSEIQALAIGGFALNKLTGGLVTNIAGGIFGALKAMTVQAAVVNVTGGIVNGGGLPGGIPGGAAGLGAGAALGIGGAAVGLGVIAAVNSPLWVKNTTLNTTNENAGLTQAERAAQTYYTASAADQAQMRKHILVMPTLADFQSGSIKLGMGGSIRVDAPAVVAAIKSTAFHDSRERRGRPSPPPFHDSRERRGPLSLESMRRGTERFVVKSPSVTTNVDVNVKVTAAGIQKTVTVHKRYGPPAGSRESWIGHDTYDR
jgi:hypothetical protein